MKKALATRLYWGFSAAVILVIAVGVSAYQAQKREEYYRLWVTNTYQSIDKAKSLNITIAQMRKAQWSYYLNGKPSYLIPYQQALPGIPTTIDELEIAVADKPVLVRYVDSIDQATKRLLDFWENVKNNATLAKGYADVISPQIEDNINVIYANIDRLILGEENLLAQREAEDKTADRQAEEVLVGGILLVLIVVFVLIYFILHEFRNRSSAEADLQKSITEIKGLVEDADKRNWQLTGITKITDGMHAAYSLSGLINNIIKNLADYMGLPAAVFYLFDEDTQTLSVKGSAGAVVKEDVAFKPSQLPGGLPGIKEVKIIKQVPVNFWEVHSAMGNAKPVEIAFIGLYIGRELKGVVELASFTGFSREHIELLRAVLDNMAVSLHAAQTRERVIRLLEQVQEQKETLENQQEELRLSNEELTRQAEILQASEEEMKLQEQELRHINAELEEKNEAVEMARRALQENAKELDAVSRYKSEFLANMSHELRTPLNSILILARLLADNKQQNLTGKQAEYAGIIHKSGNELLSLINDILDLSKIESGKVEVHPERTSAENIAENITPQFRVLADEKKINFITQIDADVPGFVVTDRPKLEQVIKNLLSNAFKFTPPSGTVTLQFSAAGAVGLRTNFLPSAAGILAISVTDTGIGISSEKQRLIFEAFQQADGSTSRKYGGTGLGLSISKELVRLLGGEIHVTSQVGEGSTFTVLVPQQWAFIAGDKTKEPMSAAPARVYAQQMVKDDRDDIEPGDKVMLIVEDDIKFASILRDFARNRQYKTVIALSGDEGLMSASKYVPAAIILDIQLPVLDGWSVLKALKKNNKLSHIPVHIISSMDTPNGHTEGALAYLKKPVDGVGLEKAFDDISNYLASNIKKVLFFSDGHLNAEDLQQLLFLNKITAKSKFVTTKEEAFEALRKKKYDCIIVDIGENIYEGIEQLNSLHESGCLAETPLIIYLDKDISQEDEWKLKKFSSVVIRHSEHARQRLIDELELFLYRIQQSQKTNSGMGRSVMGDDLLAGKKILIVDDDMRNVFALTVALDEHKMKVCTANDGKEALAVLAKNKDTAIVLMDIMMPEMDGYEAIRQIRNTMKLDKLPIIALTAKAMQGDQEKSIEAGASDYIAKPVDINKVLSVLRVWLAQ